jgi:hypothetical protein
MPSTTTRSAPANTPCFAPSRNTSANGFSYSSRSAVSHFADHDRHLVAPLGDGPQVLPGQCPQLRGRRQVERQHAAVLLAFVVLFLATSSASSARGSAPDGAWLGDLCTPLMGILLWFVT